MTGKMILCYGYLQLREKYPDKDDDILRGSCYGEAVWEVAEKSIVFCTLRRKKKRSTLWLG